MRFAFTKMHGAANDFVAIDHRAAFLPADVGPLVRRLCDRRRGVGADGVLLLESAEGVDAVMRYYNADGGAADYCGNGARCTARLALELGLGTGGRLRLATAAGVQEAWRDGDRYVVRFGRVAAPVEVAGVEACGRSFAGRAVTAGVPHFVVEADDLAAVPLDQWGAALRRHTRWGAAGSNVDFVAARGEDTVAMRTFERGVEGETLACGSGAIASALWAAARGARSPVRVLTAGGDTLVVGFTRDGEHYDVTLAGPAEVAFRGEWSDADASGGA